MQEKRRISPLSIMYSCYAFLWLFVFLLTIVPFAFVALCIQSPLGINLFYRVSSFCARAWFFLVGMRFKEIHSGLRSAKECGQGIYIANHSSYIDVMIMLAVMRWPYRPLGKAEMKKIPVFGFFYDKFVLTVNRDNGSSRLKSLMELNETVGKNLSVFIFPEGTFNESGAPLKEFYNGAFQLALKNNLNLRPIAFLDSQERMHYSSFFLMRPGICRAVFLQEITIKHYVHYRSSELKEIVFERMKSTLLAYKQ